MMDYYLGEGFLDLVSNSRYKPTRQVEHWLLSLSVSLNDRTDFTKTWESGEDNAGVAMLKLMGAVMTVQSGLLHFLGIYDWS